jgi:hypothetical protein
MFIILLTYLKGTAVRYSEKKTECCILPTHIEQVNNLIIKLPNEDEQKIGSYFQKIRQSNYLA